VYDDDDEEEEDDDVGGPGFIQKWSRVMIQEKERERGSR
jgi:hypothetical protein